MTGHLARAFMTPDSVPPEVQNPEGLASVGPVWLAYGLAAVGGTRPKKPPRTPGWRWSPMCSLRSRGPVRLPPLEVMAR